MIIRQAGGAALAALALIALPVHAQERAPTMEITRKADLKTIDGPADWFTGRVTITGQFQREARLASGAL